MATGRYDNKCMGCGNKLKDGKTAMFISRCTVVKSYVDETQVYVRRSGGRVKQKGLLCLGCSNKILPASFYFEDMI